MNKLKNKYLIGGIGSGTNPSIKPLIIIGILLVVTVIMLFIFSKMEFNINLTSFVEDEKKEIQIGNLNHSNSYLNNDDSLKTFDNLKKPIENNNLDGNLKKVNKSIIDSNTLLTDYKELKNRVNNTSHFIKYTEAKNLQNKDLRKSSIISNSNNQPKKPFAIQTNKVNKTVSTKKVDRDGCKENQKYIEYLGCTEINNSNSKSNNIKLSQLELPKQKKEKLLSNKKSNNENFVYIEKGYLINVTLLTDVTSQFQGFVKSVVNKDITDSTGEYVVIPKGSYFIGTNKEIKKGYDKERVEIVWQRIELKDKTIDIKDYVTLDKEGKTGVEADNESGTNYGKLFVSTLIAGTIGLGIDNESEDNFTKSLNKQLTNTSNKLIDNVLNKRTIYEIKKGTELNVLLKNRLSFNI